MLSTPAIQPVPPAPSRAGREPVERETAGVRPRPAERAWIAFLAVVVGAATTVALLGMARPAAGEIALAAVFAGLVALAWLFPVPFAFKTDLCLDLSVLLAAVLLFDPALAILLAASGTAASHAIRRKEPIEGLFNALQVALQVAAGSALLAVAGWDRVMLDALGPGTVVRIAVTAITMIAITDVTVAVMVAAQSGMHPGRTWLSAMRQTGGGDATAQLAQIGLGAAGAILVNASPWTLALLLLPAGAVHVSLATAQRERRRSAEALRNTEAALAEAERIANLGSWEWDLATGRIGWSDQVHRILGTVPGPSVPTWTSLLDAVHPDDRPAVAPPRPGAGARRGAFLLEHRIRRADGRERTVSAHGEVLRGADGEKRRLIATIQDVTERKRAEQARDDLLVSLSHDLKSPLTVIQGQAQLLTRRLDRPERPLAPETLRHGLEQIDATAQAMAAQITDLLEFARKQMGGTLAMRPVDLATIARRRAALLQQATEAHRIVVTTPTTGAVVIGDRRHLESVIDNLLTNSIKYSPDGGTVLIDVAHEHCETGSRVVVRVRDHGIGIPPEDLSRIFNSFQRGSNVGRIEGSGIGLAAVKRLVALHGGTIEADSSSTAGTTFTLRFPAAD